MRKHRTGIIVVCMILLASLAMGCEDDATEKEDSPNNSPGDIDGDGTSDESDMFPAIPSVVLDIPPREQWSNDHGYCGSCSIQTAGLYHGMYISQKIVRETVGDEEVLPGINLEDALDALNLEYESWDYEDHDTEDYLQWIKKELGSGDPVIFTVNVDGLDNEYYDHIMLGVGYASKDADDYDDEDILVYNDGFESVHLNQSFAELRDETNYYYLNPTWHYGTVVKGIKDSEKVTLPVHIEMERWSEPNVSVGKDPVLFSATVIVGSLEVGESYVLLRYDDHESVPVSGFSIANSDHHINFTADGKAMSFPDSFYSDGVAIYRCIPYQGDEGDG